ncbi:MAG: glutathione S-transferase [Gammaproteobacteria bacterium]|nr:glutathione S-transferase [Gammaproteobacteria bacterium]
MILYDMTQAPNPRRVRIFIAEKGTPVELRTINMMAGEHKTPEHLARHPSGKIPALETDDGQFIGESVAICRYLEAMHPKPDLLGSTPLEVGRIDMFNRILEFELWSQIGTSWVNGPVVAKMAAGRFKQIPEAKAASDTNTHRFYERLNRELGTRSHMADNRYSIADITALVAIDFASSMVGLKPADNLKNLWEWHARMSARPSAKA